MPRSMSTRVGIPATAALTAAALVAAALSQGRSAPTRGPAGPAPAAGRSVPDLPPARPKRAPRRPRPLPELSLPARPAARVLHLPILTYHRIGARAAGAPAITQALTVDPLDFARQMSWLRSRGFHTVTQRQLFEALAGERPLPARPVLVNFDDGYRDVLVHAAPVLRRLGMSATVYVISGRLSDGVPFLGCPGLRELERRGVEVGSHTVSHRDLATLSDAEASRELAGSRAALERCVRHPVQWLAYPYGAYDTRIVRLARRAGYVLATTTVDGTSQDARAPLELQRIRVLNSTGVAGLRSTLDR